MSSSEVSFHRGDGQQSGSCGVHRKGDVALLRLDTHLLVLRQDLGDGALGVADLPTRNDDDGKFLWPADVLQVHHSNSQAVIRQRLLPHLKTV